MGTPAILRLLFKYYGGIDWFEDKSFDLFIDCLNHAITKENEIPKLINKVFEHLSNKTQFKSLKKKMKSAEELLKEYGLEGIYGKDI